MSPFHISRAKSAHALPLISASVGGALADGCNWVAQKVTFVLSVAALMDCCSLALCFARAFACREQVRACSRYDTQVVAITSNAHATKEPVAAGARLSLAVLSSAADDAATHAVEPSNASV